MRTISGSAWGDSVLLVEDLAIGTLEGDDELMFGRIGAIAPDSSGGVYVFDGQVPALRYYDSNGRYVRTLGREGSGPGEYRDVALGLAVRHDDGRVVMQDPQNARLNVYTPSGESSDSWRYDGGLFAARTMSLDAANHVYLKILRSQPERNKPWKIGLLHLDDHGNVVDTIAPPMMPGEPASAGGRFLPAKHWDWSPLGYMVVGVSATYEFELRLPGQVRRIAREVPMVTFDAEERAELNAQTAWLQENQGQFLTADIPDIPNYKVPYQALYTGADGRIWVWRHVPAERIPIAEQSDPVPGRPGPVTWREPVVFDVFEKTGEFLGEVRVPPRTTIKVFGTTSLWGIRRGAYDEQYVVRLRLGPTAR